MGNVSFGAPRKSSKKWAATFYNDHFYGGVCEDREAFH